ncbi:MAG TPA: L,D-transpeptidase [Thermoanaerobaculia bacterium]|nr:L,D-transpeptidase [Thermoanaerobaculia bacterium]
MASEPGLPALPPLIADLEAAAEAERRRHRRHGWIAVAVAVAVIAGAILALAMKGRAYRALPLDARAVTSSSSRYALRRLAAYEPHGTYIVVDTYSNRLRLFRHGKLQRQAVCSTGSGVVLRDPRDGHIWVFDTPTGERRVQRKVKNPVWNKPDWAFIEEGLKPPHRSRDRVDDFSLGDYALYLGNGYIIHGTIFQTLLGRPITHGCIRLGDKDLDYVYHHTPLGTPVFLF